MSDHIKKVLKDHVREYFENHPPTDGQFLAAHYEEEEFTEGLAEALLELEEQEDTELLLDGNSNTKPAICFDQGPDLYVLHVRSEFPGENSGIETGQGLATGLRNYVLDGDVDDRNAAGFLVIDPDAYVDTFNPAELLTDEGSPLSIETISKSLLNPDRYDNPASKATIKAVSTYLSEDLYDDETSWFTELSKISVALDQKDVDELAEAIGELPEMLKLDYLPTNLFEMSLDEDGIESAKREILKDLKTARKHAKRFDKAFQPGEDTAENLRKNYEEEFVEKHRSKDDWNHIGLSEAYNADFSNKYKPDESDEGPDEESERSGESDEGPDEESERSGESDEGPDEESERSDELDEGPDEESEEGSSTPDEISVTGRGGSDGNSDSPPEPESIEISTEEFVKRTLTSGPFTKARKRHVVRCTTTEDSVEVILGFTESLNPDTTLTTPNQEDDSVEVDGDEVSFEVEGLENDAIQWKEFEVYVNEETRRPHPTVQVHLAILPQWWFQVLGEEEMNIQYDPNEGCRFVLHNRESLSLTPPGAEDTDERETENISEDGQNISITGPVTLYPRTPPMANGSAERLFYLTPPEPSEINPLPILTYDDDDEIRTENVHLPMSVEAIINPEKWTNDSLVMEDVETNEGIIQANGRQFIPNDQRLQSIVQVEEEFVDEETVAPRRFDGRTFASTTSREEDFETPDALDGNYDRLLQHHADRGTVPSTDPWDAETRTKVRDVVEAYLSSMESESDETLSRIRRIGMVTAGEDSQRHWLTAFHPLMLAYGLRLAKWRDNHLDDNGLTEGFRYRPYAAQLTPSGLLPYWSRGADSDPLQGRVIQNHSLWMGYSPLTSYDAETPDFMRELVSEKVIEFREIFAQLFDVHAERPLVINLVNMGGLGDCLEGLADVVETFEDSEEYGCPPFRLQVYGSGGQGRALDSFFRSGGEESPLSGREEQIIEKLRKRITYTKAGPEAEIEDAHITFFRGILESRFAALGLNDLPDRFLRDGLLPRESTDIEGEAGERTYTHGFGCGDSSGENLQRAAREANRIEHGHRNQEVYTPEDQIARIVKSTSGTSQTRRLDEILEHSIWGVHVQPPVGLEFYIQGGESNTNGPLVIHHDDTRSTSPGYDAITTTKRQQLYVSALEEKLADIDRDRSTDSQQMLEILTALEGQAMMKLQRAAPGEIAELVGVAGSLVLSRVMLSHNLDNYAWIAVNLGDELQHDLARRHERPGSLPPIDANKASDDLMFIGVPKRVSDDELTLKLWFTEAKGGTSPAQSGVEQVMNTIAWAKELFDPSEPFADTEILRTAFGRLAVDSASRLRSYSLLEQDEMDIIEKHTDALLDGDFEVELLEDAGGHQGEVINVGGTEIERKINSGEDNVRRITVPADVFGLLNEMTLTEYFDEELKDWVRFG